MSNHDTINKFDKSRFHIAEKYIRASKNLIEGMLNSGNPRAIISDHIITSDELTEATKNSSQNIILPTLFCLYQGMELILKGFICAKCNNNNRHDTESLCRQFSILYAEENELTDLFNKFVFSPKEFIKKYMETNNIKSISEFYNSLRYPDKNSGETYNYDSLLYYENELFLPLLEEIKNDIDNLLVFSVKLFRLMEDTYL